MRKKIIALGVILMGIFVFSGLYEARQSTASKHQNTSSNSDSILFEVTASYDSIYDNSNTEELEDRSELILIGNVQTIDGVINYSSEIEEYIMTSTIGTIQVKNIIKSNQAVSEDDIISFIRVGGTISVGQYMKALEPRQIVRQGLSELTEEEKQNKYVKFAYEDDIEIEEGKDYLIYLKYESELKRYRIIGMEYGLKEYNTLTKKVKDNHENKWKSLEYDI